MTTPLLPVSTSDPAALTAALAAALSGGPAVLPVAPGLEDAAAQAVAAHPEVPAGTALVIRTSGSTGVPKLVALPATALRASAEATAERFGGDGQWLVTLPLHLISGAQMLVRSILGGTEPVFLAQPAQDDDFLAAAAEMTGKRRYVSLVPVQFSRLLDRATADPAAAATLRRFDAILVGGQALPRALRQRAHELDLRLVRSYGMSESAGGCVYDGVEIGDTLVRIRGGEVQLAGPSLASGYLGDAEQTEERFFVDGDTRWYRTGDAGELLGGMLTVLGRLDNVIVSGGVNVSLDEVERVAKELPGWGEAVAVGVPDDTWGERVALVRPAAPGEPEPESPAAAIRAELGVAAVPARFDTVEEMPRLAGGKPDRISLRARLLG